MKASRPNDYFGIALESYVGVSKEIGSRKLKQTLKIKASMPKLLVIYYISICCGYICLDWQPLKILVLISLGKSKCRSSIKGIIIC